MSSTSRLVSLTQRSGGEGVLAGSGLCSTSTSSSLSHGSSHRPSLVARVAQKDPPTATLPASGTAAPPAPAAPTMDWSQKLKGLGKKKRTKNQDELVEGGGGSSASQTAKRQPFSMQDDDDEGEEDEGRKEKRLPAEMR